ncbi:insulin gene enhancer protein ISL-1-like [Polyodon spathula]|uniref:insulin gene enhancer protein ISL-1-like n=1 Tax=Polyodon spathula TaxID=7913 RepID=UPI001B7EFF8D|nr:insulin gene enhancer protein ISL-1-like [Polyodon spathula]
MGEAGDSTERPVSVAVCAGCRLQIRDPIILHVSPDLDWHASCLRCSECHCRLEDRDSCFLRDGRTFCREDYLRMFAVRCAQCGEPVLSSDLVLKARGRVYHRHCFRCVVCARQLLPGDQFTLQPGGLHCQTEQLISESPEEELGDSGSPQPGLTGSPCEGRALSGGERLARVRTVLSEPQLLALRSCYAMNPRPDALAKEQLVKVTGLSHRVVRVWFQNKRCKDKKRTLLLARQGPLTPRDNTTLQGVSATLLVASSPEPQDATLPRSPLRVERYESPWQRLSGLPLLSEEQETLFLKLVSFSKEWADSNSPPRGTSINYTIISQAANQSQPQFIQP